MARFNPPPTWPVPRDFEPPAGWEPDPSWPKPPPGWVLWFGEPSPSINILEETLQPSAVENPPVLESTTRPGGGNSDELSAVFQATQHGQIDVRSALSRESSGEPGRPANYTTTRPRQSGATPGEDGRGADIAGSWQGQGPGGSAVQGGAAAITRSPAPKLRLRTLGLATGLAVVVLALATWLAAATSPSQTNVFDPTDPLPTVPDLHGTTPLSELSNLSPVNNTPDTPHGPVSQVDLEVGGGTLTVSLGQTRWDATALVEVFTPALPAPEGYVYVTVPVTLEYSGISSVDPADPLRVYFMDDDGHFYRSSGALGPRPLRAMGSIGNDESLTGNVVFCLPEEAVESGTWAVTVANLSNAHYIEIQ